MYRKLLLIIILATLARISPAQSREASILESLISAADTLAAPAEASSGAETSQNPFASLISHLKHDTVSHVAPSKISTLSLTFITRTFLTADYYSTGTASGAEAGDPALFMTYLRRCGPLTSPYGWRESSGRPHRGVDVAMAVGDTVRAALSGTVECIDCQPRGYGHYVTLVHEGGLETRYAHLSRTLVTPGQYVMAGEPIALSGNSGNSTGPHLHFETRLMKIPFDPLGGLAIP